MDVPQKNEWEAEGSRAERLEPAAAMPSLARPLAAFGAAAGLFAILALGAWREPARDVSPLAPMIATAIVGAIVGTTLSRWQRLQHPMLAREAIVLWVSIITAIGGAVSGGVVGLATWGIDGFVKFTFGGALVGLAFVPSCLVVFDAARRAGRGRHGSLVAATDARTVLSTVLAGVAFAGATQVPAILAFETSNELAPLAQVALSLLACGGATIGILALERRDRRARVALEGFAKDAPWLDRIEGGDASLAAAALDLGIGDDRWARSTDASYRSSGRADVLVKGSITDATAAFEECTRRRHHALIVAACGLTATTVSFLLRLSVYL